MEVSEENVEPSGQELVQTLVTLTGLPEPWINQELVHIVEKSGQEVGNLTLEDLREAMLVYLESMKFDVIAEGSSGSD